MRPAVVAAVTAAVLADLLWPLGWAERGLRPDFALLVVVAAGFLGRGPCGFHAGLLAGFLAAPLTLEPFGLDAALLGASGLVAGRVAVYVRSERAAVRTTVAALLSFGLGVVALLRIEMAAAEVDTLALVGSVVVRAASTGLAAAPVLAILEGLRVFGRRSEWRPALV